MGLLLAACGGAEPGPSGQSTTQAEATAGSDGTAATETDADGGSSTTWMPPDLGPPPPSQTATCARYVACATELAVEGLDTIEQMYGQDGACWQGDQAQATACSEACGDELAALVMGLQRMGQAVPEACEPPTMVSWAEVETLLEDHCVAGCHEPGGEDSSLDLSDGPYSAIILVASDQSDLYLVDPGSRDESYLWHKVNGSQGAAGGGGARMPKGATPLADAEIEAIGDWIDAGASMF